MATSYSIKGSIKDANGKPLKDLMIQAMDSDQEWFDDRSDDLLGSTRAKKDGTFEIPFDKERFADSWLEGTMEVSITGLNTPIAQYAQPISLGKKEFSADLPTISGKYLKESKRTYE